MMMFRENRSAVRKLRLALEYFVPWTNDAGYQVALSRGWYREAGIDLRLAVIDPFLGDSLEHLAAGEVELAVFPTNRLFVRREAGQPLRAIAAVNHRAMETIQTLTSAGISRPRDLAGRRLALNPTPRGTALVRHLVEADGGDPDTVVLVDSGSREITVDDLAEGFADAFFGGYWAWDAMFGAVPEAERVTWPVDTIGAPPYHPYLIGTRDALLAQEPDVLRDFLQVTEEGFREVAADPEGALAVVAGAIPYVRPALLERSLELIAPTWFDATGAWGRHREELHAPYAEWLAHRGILRDADIWRSAVTADLLPALATPGLAG
jgi:putative hydroxymethylpyrimidine transport system substrate-binding protein